jgi:DnaK suppressor protein
MERTLIRRRDALRRTLSEELDQFDTFQERSVGDSVDAALDTDYGSVSTGLAEFESRELDQIERALERLREGRYGICEVCGKKIATARLEALPYATMCIQCQRSCEQRNSTRPVERDWRRVDELGEDGGNSDHLTWDALDLVA